ncbi:MAG: endo-1,4-beta-xylanase [Defluviitaleaceae bacterium]|nr:endo-1,4-beta-xylanase [Defluviitaleaceae bacterium]
MKASYFWACGIVVVIAVVLTIFLHGRSDEEYDYEPAEEVTEGVAEGVAEESTEGETEENEVQPMVRTASIIEGLEPGLNFDQFPSLWETHLDYFMIGAAGDYAPQWAWNPVGSPRDALIAHHYNAWTFENSMKPQPIRGGGGSRTTFNTGGVNGTIGAVTAAWNLRNEGMPAFIGHTLAWHSQTPSWMWDGHDDGAFDRETALANLNEHIDFVMLEWGHQLQAIDVVNEAMGALNPADAADWRTSLMNHAQGWSLALGYEWVELAFLRAAYIADREGMDVLLYYNDFGLDGLAKATAVAAMVQDINERHAGVRPSGRLLIEGIGMQGHYNMNTNIDNVAYNIRRFAALGVMVSITELDISMLVTDPSGFLTPEQEILQGQIYAQLFQVLRRYAAGPATEGSAYPRVVERVTFWGTNDGNSWRGGSRPLLFNPVNSAGEITGKQALLAVLDPDAFLEINPIIPPEPVVIPGVYEFYEDADGFTGINIVPGEAFTPQPGATYRLFVEYMIRGTFGMEAHFLDGQAYEGMSPLVGGSDGPVAQGLPAVFAASPGAVNGSQAWLHAEFSFEDDSPFYDIALRGLHGESGIEFVQVQIYRVGDGVSQLLVNWPHLVPEGGGEGTQGVHVHSMGRGDAFSHANILIGSGRDIWPFADAYEDGLRAFEPEPGVTYRLSFNVTSQGTTGWRIRWIPGTGGETYTTADAAIVNNHPVAMDDIAYVIPAHFNIGGVMGETYTLVVEITLDGAEEYMGLIGNIALRGTGGGNAYEINWVRIERLEGGPGSDVTELLAFYPYGI